MFAGQTDWSDPTEAFDAARPQYLDGLIGEEAGRSFDAAMMGWGEQADGLIRGAQNAWATLTGNDEAQEQLDLEAAQANEFRNKYVWLQQPYSYRGRRVCDYCADNAPPRRLLALK